MQTFKFQIGQFFLVIGVIMLAVFFVTDQGKNPQFLLFFGGLLIIAAGVSLMTRNRTPLAGESMRFRGVRRYRQKSRERREKKRQREQERRDQRQHDRRAQRRQEQLRQQEEQRERQS
jgi:Sec-independent protein translocase protein TatA